MTLCYVCSLQFYRINKLHDIFAIKKWTLILIKHLISDHHHHQPSQRVHSTRRWLSKISRLKQAFSTLSVIHSVEFTKLRVAFSSWFMKSEKQFFKKNRLPMWSVKNLGLKFATFASLREKKKRLWKAVFVVWWSFTVVKIVKRRHLICITKKNAHI